MFKRAIRLIAIASCLAQVPHAPAQAADVKQFLEPCRGEHLCPWFLADVEAPAGWASDENFGRAQKIVAFFPKKDLQSDDPMIYVRTTYNGDNRTLDTQATDSNAHWKKIAGRTDIERLPDIPRGEGKGAWQVYRYVNHDQPKQAHEVLAFGEHVEQGNQKFFYMVVVSAAQRDAVDRSEASWREILNRL